MVLTQWSSVFLPLLLTYRGLSGQEIGWVLAIGSAWILFHFALSCHYKRNIKSGVKNFC